MEKKSEKPAADRLTAPNAAADSNSRRALMVKSEAPSLQESAAASSPKSEVFDLPPSEFGNNLTTRYFLTRMDRLDDGAWLPDVVLEVGVEELARGCGFDPGEFSALTSDQREKAAGFLLDGFSPDAAIKAAGNFSTLKLVERNNA